MSKSCFVLFQAAPLNSTAIFELRIHFSFGARLLPVAVIGLIASSDSPYYDCFTITSWPYESTINWL